MSRYDLNRQRAFAEIVSVEAWHVKLSPDVTAVGLYADVVFRTARVGGESESKVRFRLSIRRAELVVIIPETEPFAVDKRSVLRFDDVKTATRSFEESVESVQEVDGKLKLGASVAKFAASVSTSLKGHAKHRKIEKIKGTEKQTSINVTYWFHNSEKNYRWTLKPETGPLLQGRPWNALESRLLGLVDQRAKRGKSIPPSVRLEIRCAREDLEIEDIEIKDLGLWENLVDRPGSRNRIKAAEAYIKNRLEEAGLNAGDLSDKFASVTLAEVVANNGPVG